MLEAGEMDPRPFIDPYLRLIVAACMASNPKQRPTLAQLEGWVYTAIHEFTPANYGHLPGGAVKETDESIREIVTGCILNAQTNR